ncbi:hypothetical protein ACFYO0_35455 [Streptomyces sp. NPDC006365]|uniref:hypothetical protein n=1 Tax=Streptomyces sp. NPDC006365 TaxID=3364744 RepID=UPI0036BBF943
MAPRAARCANLVAVTLTTLLLATASPAAHSATNDTTHVEGRLPSGATYMMDVPADWNGTVLVYSHGYVDPGSSNPARDAPDGTTQSLLLAQGYALIGSSYATTGFAIADAVPSQMQTLDAFTSRFGPARRTIAWGDSFGGLVTTAIAERHGNSIDGSLSMCGLVQGGVANWNDALDTVFALKTLIAPDADIPLTDLSSPQAAADAAGALTAAVTEAQSTPEGRARIALAAALHNIPVWNSANQTRPAPTDWAAQEANQYSAILGFLQRTFIRRQDAEARAGGNPSWTTGVNFAALLAKSSVAKGVGELYKSAGLSLKDDLTTLNHAPTISENPAALAETSTTSALTGKLTKPQMDIHTIGDPTLPVQVENAYHRAVTAAGSGALLRRAYVDNAGHCSFSAAERLGALNTLEDRITTGHWPDTDAAALNNRAAAADPTTPARYTAYQPGPYPRPYDLAHPADRP